MNEVKQKIINEIENTVSVFHKISSTEYRIRCPLCGDSQKDFKAAHLYLKCSFDPSEPILYICFKCNSKGRLTKYFLDKLNIQVENISDVTNEIFNKVSSIRHVEYDILTGVPVLNSPQTEYIIHRLGDTFKSTDYDVFKIIWDMSTVIPYISDVRVKNTLPSNHNSISFLSDDKSTLITRFFTDDYPCWKKTKLFQSTNKSFYTIKTELDLFTTDTIVVNIAEGIFDILSVYKNFNNEKNSVHIAVLGSDYRSGIDYAIATGIIGSNVNVKLYVDSDIDVQLLKYKIKKYKWLFNQICIYKNIKDVDFGVTSNRISTVEYHL